MATQTYTHTDTPTKAISGNQVCAAKGHTPALISLKISLKIHTHTGIHMSIATLVVF